MSIECPSNFCGTLLPNSTSVRTILPIAIFKESNGCSLKLRVRGGWLDRQRPFMIDDSIPQALLDRGVQLSEWKKFNDMLRHDIMPSVSLQGSCGRFMVDCFSSSICAICCPQESSTEPLRKEMITLTVRLDNWANCFNAEVLQPRGLFAKFQTAYSTTYEKNYGEGGDDTFVIKQITWLAIALIQSEAEILRNEPLYWSNTKVTTHEETQLFIFSSTVTNVACDPMGLLFPAPPITRWYLFNGVLRIGVTTRGEYLM